MRIEGRFSLLYQELLEDAKSIIFHDKYDWNYVDRPIMAHDITVDFLYSWSFRHTYDPKKGDLKAFFGSYVRKKLLGARETSNKHRLICSLNKLDISSFGWTIEKQYECREVLRKGREIARYAPNPPFSLQLYDSMCASVLKFGKVKFEYVGRQCQISTGYARRCSRMLLEGINRRLLRDT